VEGNRLLVVGKKNLKQNGRHRGYSIFGGRGGLPHLVSKSRGGGRGGDVTRTLFSKTDQGRGGKKRRLRIGRSVHIFALRDHWLKGTGVKKNGADRCYVLNATRNTTGMEI